MISKPEVFKKAFQEGTELKKEDVAGLESACTNFSESSELTELKKLAQPLFMASENGEPVSVSHSRYFKLSVPQLEKDQMHCPWRDNKLECRYGHYVDFPEVKNNDMRIALKGIAMKLIKIQIEHINECHVKTPPVRHGSDGESSDSSLSQDVIWDEAEIVEVSESQAGLIENGKEIAEAMVREGEAELDKLKGCTAGITKIPNFVFKHFFAEAKSIEIQFSLSNCIEIKKYKEYPRLQCTQVEGGCLWKDRKTVRIVTGNVQPPVILSEVLDIIARGAKEHASVHNQQPDSIAQRARQAISHKLKELKDGA